MTFFKPEDFDIQQGKVYTTESHRSAEVANAKLEREGKVVYFLNQPDMEWMTYSAHKKFLPSAKYKALLINIEPIEKCKHSIEKIRRICNPNDYTEYKCECGANVKPTSFEEVK